MRKLGICPGPRRFVVLISVPRVDAMTFDLMFFDKNPMYICWSNSDVLNENLMQVTQIKGQDHKRRLERSLQKVYPNSIRLKKVLIQFF